MPYQDIKALVGRYHCELDAADKDTVAGVLSRYVADDFLFRGVHPFNELTGAQAVAETVWMPLRRSLRSVQRRQDIFMAGTSERGGGQWVMSMGHLMGLFDEDWLGIPATRKLVFLRYAEFNRVENNRIAECGFFCDIPGLMMQVGLSPFPPQTGAEIVVPGPRTHDGILANAQDEAESLKTLDLVDRMKNDLTSTYDTALPPELLAKTWHSDMLWYGPTGIGSTYTIHRYQEQHQHPFRNGLANLEFNDHICRFAEGDYAGWFGWPNLSMTPAGGFLGLPASDCRTIMRVVDVYRRDGDKLAENWVLIDLLHWLKQQGVDVLERNRRILGR